MKTNIKIVDTNNNPISSTDKRTLRWYKWEEYCDDCGKLTPNSELFHSNVPDLNEADYCYECLKKRFSKSKIYPTGYESCKYNTDDMWTHVCGYKE